MRWDVELSIAWIETHRHQGWAREPALPIFLSLTIINIPFNMVGDTDLAMQPPSGNQTLHAPGT
jgi:hypothetical protein